MLKREKNKNILLRGVVSENLLILVSSELKDVFLDVSGRGSTSVVKRT